MSAQRRLTSKDTTIHLHFGALAQPLDAQLRRQGFRLPLANEAGRKELEHLQRDADAVTRLKVRGLMNDSGAKRMREAILAQVREVVISTPPPKRARKGSKE